MNDSENEFRDRKCSLQTRIFLMSCFAENRKNKHVCKVCD